MAFSELRIPFTVDDSGDAVVYGGRSVFGRLVAVIYDRGDMDTNTDYILTFDQYAVVETVLTITNAGSADKIWYPRRVVQNQTGGNLSGTNGGDREPFLVIGRPKLTVDEGGVATSGAIILITED